MLELVDELVAGTATSGGGGSAPAVIEELNVTPSTSAQTITAPSGTDGYSPVNVSAVTSSIDANIQATNIKDGVDILGVTGTLVEGGDIITATNNTGSAIMAGEKVWLNESGGNYNAVDFYSSQKNLCFGKIGTPTIDSDYIASGFNNSVGFVGPFAFPFGTADSWEIGFKVKTSYIPGGTGTNYQIFFASSTATSGLLPIMQKSGGIIFIYPSGHVFIQGVYLSSSSAPDVSIRTTNTMTVNTWEYIKIGFTGTKYYIAQSSDGVNWTQGEEFSSTTKLYQPTDSFSLGATFNSSGYAFNNGSIDLKEVYIIIDGVKTWIPVMQRTNVDENSLTGYAKENIASGLSGTVETTLDITTHRIVAVSNSSSSSAYSDDNGMTWNASTLPATGGWRACAFGNGTYVAVTEPIGDDTESTLVAFSNDGKTWTQSTLPAGKWYNVCYGNGVFVAISYGSNYFAYSSDGETWTITSLSDSSNWTNIAYGNGLFVVTGNNKYAYSSDGETWTVSTLPSNGTWRIAFGNGLFVMIKQSSTVARYSADGVNWTLVTLPSSKGWYHLAFSNGVFLTVTIGSLEDGYITLTSTDGASWSQTSTTTQFLSETYDTGYNLRAVCATPEGFLGLTRNGEYTFKAGADGEWTVVQNSPALDGSDWNGVCLGNLII